MALQRHATQLIKQLMTEKYSRGGNGTGIREHISKMNHLNNKLKPMDLAIEEEFLVHVIFASLPKWDLERCMTMCV
jgi:hypothetical protein